ncbi:MAG: GNAT family N-acetyltransferase [Candidatus Dactylopiibacterium carminicum]|uniref:L-ornithine N(alpha)-acyltransferase n=1 Tax=Candidatus Dactylopiibacterium carminicum TaxID=857335 RepID=A0A272EVW2_9RHOO|nr:GNAT family N-acyltransferase [Candidatus Dactylopiibacterium carminicum]KAF7599595.1 GNAT family N-acetyltransferase [Candidatus Dactylopiibacterium carminicum]PAS94242.1 MAG: GNAT family N-acetyltransferase [Candidatus Dactylopiibacterium carminicum]PAS98439.1 MAG: GNAT family N-acetyltransferase [Candidatus Dactylopiibacterium carminicum]PAS99597.1 MAG: GNAT family N-acetyltransferase [Candidatus Dactylopiibacterium carminicum]
MLRVESQAVEQKSRDLWVGLAATESEILEAQKLRYRVFAEEMGARLNTRTPGVDRDHFDAHCQHLIVRDEAQGRIVGTYRILTPEAARRIGGYYSETEFDLTRLQHLRPGLVEIGRSCIDADYRTGAVITLLWNGLSRFMLANGYDHLMGCASVGMADGGHNAANLYRALQDKLAPVEYHVFPRNPLPVEALASDIRAELPPLLKGYLRAGAQVCGAPAWDPDFNTADLFILLSMKRVDSRYAKHFVERQGA